MCDNPNRYISFTALIIPKHIENCVKVITRMRAAASCFVSDGT